MASPAKRSPSPFNSLTSYVPALYVGTDDKLYAEVLGKGAVDPLVSAAVVNDGGFHPLAVTYDGASEMVYLDGLVIGGKPVTQRAYAGSYQYQLSTGYTPGWPPETADGTHSTVLSMNQPFMIGLLRSTRQPPSIRLAR